MGDRYVGPKGRILTYISLAEMPDIPHWTLSNLSHNGLLITSSFSRQLLSPMAYTAPTSARVWNAPRGGTVSCMDPRSHLVDTLGLGGYKSNQEVGVCPSQC